MTRDTFKAKGTPPSAPVGVEGLHSLIYLWRQPEPDNGEDETEFDLGCAQTYNECADALEEALAQQPAAVDGALRAEVERLQAEIDNRWAMGVHSCHDKCQRVACVLRRDNKRLAEALRVIEGFTMSQFPDAADMAGACVETAHNALHPTTTQENKSIE